MNNLLAQRKNPNGCSPKMTYFTQIDYTNFTLVTDWYVAGNEIADHTYVSCILASTSGGGVVNSRPMTSVV